MNYLDIAPEISESLAAGKPVVALESTIISHGMPYPKNMETALKVEHIIRTHGAVPATIAIIQGQLKVGLSAGEIDYLAKKGHAVQKASRRDIPVIISRKDDGSTTVAGTMIIAKMAGIKVFCTGGIGGVHRGASRTMDISADLLELSRTNVLVVCAGAKSILDLGLTLEYLETNGVPVIGYQTSELPAFFTRKSGFSLPYRVESAEDAARLFFSMQELGYPGGAVIANPIPEQYSLDESFISGKIEKALMEAEKSGIYGKELTPYLLAKIDAITGGTSLEANIQLVYNNALVAAGIAQAFSGMNRKI
ncbi:pseudouridine-5'-phosphate glycosidase [Spirochaetia bacterium]|nr:pseudouridine-5'-phosphate glycosidase [Spirochaetia bacterium]GHU37333.1 pseudouridine-5'-phosphate glycosidase [Spirochaetia bacterium]